MAELRGVVDPLRMLAESGPWRASLVHAGAGDGLRVCVEDAAGERLLTLDGALALAASPATTAAEWRFHGILAHGLGRLEPARRAWEAMAALPEATGADLVSLAAVALEQGDIAAAYAAARRAVVLAPDESGALVRGMALVMAGEARAYGQHAVAADALATEGLEVLWQAGLHAVAAEAMLRWAWALLRARRLELAADAIAKLRAFERAEAAPGLAEALERVASVVALARGDADAAAPVAAHIRAAREGFYPLRLAELLRWLGEWRLYAYGMEAAARELDEAMALAMPAGQLRLVAELGQLREPMPAGAADAGRWRGLARQLAVLAEASTPRTMAAAVLPALVELVGAERGFMLLYDGLAVVEVVAHGADARDSDAFSTGLADHVVWSGEPVFIDDLHAHPTLGQRGSVRGGPPCSAFGVPLLARGELVGVLIVDSRMYLAAPDAEVRAIATELARHLALSVAAHREASRREARLEELGVASRVALAAAGARSLAELVPVVAREAATLFGARRVIVLAGEALAPRAAWDAESGALPLEGLGYSTSIARWVVDNGRAMHILDPREESSFGLQASVQALGARTIDVAPIIQAGRTLGVLYTDHPFDASRMGHPEGLMRIAEALGALLAREEA